MSTTTWIIIAVIIILIIAIIVGVVVYFVYFNNQTPAPTSGDGNGGTSNGGGGGSNGDGTRVKYGDVVALLNINPGAGGYAYPCGNISGQCNFNVAVRSSQSSWRIMPIEDQSLMGTDIEYGDSFLLQSTLNNSFLGYCGSSTGRCGTNVGTIADVNQTTAWSFGRSGSPPTDFVTLNTNIELINNVDSNRLHICGNSSSCSNNFNVTNNNTTNPQTSIFTWRLINVQ